MSEKNFDFNEFLAGSINSLQDPRGYFSGLKTTGGFVEPIIKALIFGLLAAIINYIWLIAGLNVAGIGFWGAAAGPMVIFWGAFGALIGLFIGAVIILIFSAITGGNTDYEANVRVTASLMVLMPINAVLNFVLIISTGLATIVGMLVSAYGLWMLFNALTQTLKAKENSAKVLVIILLVLMVFFTLLGLIFGAIFKAANYNY